MRFFHVSNNPNLDGEIIKPRVPLSRMHSEDPSTPRVCVSSSINGCLTATSGYVEGEILVVYECYSEHFTQPTEKQVIDAPLTGECWITVPVEFKYFATIIITQVLETNLTGMMNNFYAFEFAKENDE